MAGLLCRVLLVVALAISPVMAGELEVRLSGDSATAAHALPGTVAGALAGHAADELAVASFYEWGDGLPQDYGAALSWYRRAAQHGSLAAMVDGGILVANGSGTAANPVAAVAIFRAAAALGSPAAETRLGMAYQWGWGVGNDSGEAARHYRAALLGGSGAAGIYLALMP